VSGKEWSSTHQCTMCDRRCLEGKSFFIVVLSHIWNHGDLLCTMQCCIGMSLFTYQSGTSVEYIHIAWYWCWITFNTVVFCLFLVLDSGIGSKAAFCLEWGWHKPWYWDWDKMGMILV
jgi:hypothetical protein